MKRREFLKKSGVIAAGIVTTPIWFDMAGYSKTISGIQDLENLFSISSAEARQLLNQALSLGAQSADLFFEHRTGSSLYIEDGIIKDINYGIILGMGVRAIKGDQIGYAYTEAIEFDSMLLAAKTAANIADQSANSKTIRFQKVLVKNLYPVTAYSIDTKLDRKIALLNSADEAARRFNSHITSVNATFSDELRQILYFDSSGKKFQEVQPLFSLRVRAIAEDRGKRQGANASRSARAGLEFFESPANSPKSIATEAAETAVINLDARPAPAGPQVVILGPGESGVLIHEAVGHGLEADYNYKNLSNYSGRIGQKVASQYCTIIDSGLMPGMRGAINVDDEGNLPTNTVLIENGVLKCYMHNSISARMMNATPTGNGRRQSYAYPPMPRMTSTYLQKGDYDAEEIIQSVEKGVYAKGFSGGQVDIIKGDFTFGVTEAYLIENGKMTAPLKDVTLIGNGPEVMNKILMVGHDLKISNGTWSCGKDGQTVPVSVGNPTVKISEITVGGS
ncbi:MAG: metallopeptidase TldD-related protein [Candidatus Neomarinimicrobiota bacterium]